MSKDKNKDGPSEEVIDAEFEPVNESVPAPKSSQASQVSPSLWMMFVLAIMLGGILGAIGGQVLFSAKSTNSKDFTSQISELSQQFSNINGQVQLLQTQIEQQVATLSLLQQELAANSEQMISLQETSDAPNDLAPILQQMESLLTRIEALESQPQTLLTDTGNADLSALIKPIEQQMLSLKKQLETINQNPPNNDAVNTALNERLEKLETALANGSEPAELASILARMDEIQSSLQQSDFSAAKTLAIAELQLAAQGSGPFPMEHAAAQLQFPQDEGIKQLAPIAAIGAPTRQQLQQSLQVIIPDILRAANRVDETASLSQKAGAAVRSLVSIRRTDGKGSPLEIKLAKIEGLMSSGDLSGAILEMQGLDTAQTKASQTWVRDAKSRQTIEQVLSVLLAQQSSEAKP